MTTKKRRSIGHITSEENKKVSEAIDEAFHGCIPRNWVPRAKQHRACTKGVLFTEKELEKRGFSVERSAREFTPEMGHITEEEDRKVNDSIESAGRECDRKFFHEPGQRPSCHDGVNRSAAALRKKGFKATVHAVSGRKKRRR